MRRDDMAETLQFAAKVMSEAGKTVSAANLEFMADSILDALATDDCLHYDYPAERKFGGELLCGSCRIIFGRWHPGRFVMPVSIPDPR